MEEGRTRPNKEGREKKEERKRKKEDPVPDQKEDRPVALGGEVHARTCPQVKVVTDVPSLSRVQGKKKEEGREKIQDRPRRRIDR